MLAWVRRHPVRLAVYAVLATAAVWGGITVWRDGFGLMARAAGSVWVRGYVEREFGVRYVVERVTLSPGCASLTGFDVEVIGAAKARIDTGHGCLTGAVEAGGIAVGAGAVRVQSVQFRWPLSVNGEGLVWRDAAGELVAVRRFTQSGVEGLSVPEIATVQFASYAPGRVEVIGTRATVDRAALTPVPARFQAAANGLLAMVQAMLPFPARWSATAWRLLLRLLIGAAAVLLLVKIAVARTPLWALLAPFAAFPLLALMSSWVVILVAAPLVAMVLWVVAYRHKPEWHQRWEPVPVDVLTVLLAIPMLVLLAWPKLPKLEVPPLGRVVLPEVVVRDTTATVREAQCGTGDLAVVAIPLATARNLVVDGANADVERVTAAGDIRAQGVTVPFTVDYASRRAGFSAELPNIVAVKGSADLTAARIDEIRTLAGSPVQVARASARIAWPGDLVGDAAVDGIKAAGATVDKLAARFRAGAPCGGSGRIGASATLGGIAVAGPVTVSVPAAAVKFTGALAGRRLEGEGSLSTERLKIPPLQFAADLNGGFRVPKQHITVSQGITARLPRSIEFDLEASPNAAHVFIPKLAPDVSPAALELTGLQIDVDQAGPRFTIGGNKLTVPELPTGFTLQRIASLHVATRGELDHAPAFELPALKLPAFEAGEIAVTNLRAALPGLKLESIDLDTTGPVMARVHLTDTTAEAAVSQPAAATVLATATAVRVGLTAPLDTTQFGIAGSVRDLRAAAEFADSRLAGFDVRGTVQAGPLDAPATFHATNTHATFSVPSITLLPRLWASATGALDFTLTNAPAYPVADRIAEAAAGFGNHIQNANRVFGDPDTAVFPVRWDLDLDASNIMLAPDAVRSAIRADIRSLEAAQQKMDGSVDLVAGAKLGGDHLLVDLAGKSDIAALGRRWKLDMPLSLALRRELRPGADGSLFDSAWYRPFTFAVGYGEALQVHTALDTVLLFGTADGVAQAAVRWQPAAALVDSYGAFRFAGLTPAPYLEDRLDGDVRFATKAMPVDRLLIPQLQADASRIAGLDNLDLSIAVRRARETANVPGIVQIALGLDVKPANEALRVITDRLNIEFPPSALSYRSLALDFQLEHGRVRTKPALLTLGGVQMQGVNGLITDTDLRVFLGGRGRLRDLIYNFQRAWVR